MPLSEAEELEFLKLKRQRAMAMSAQSSGPKDVASAADAQKLEPGVEAPHLDPNAGQQPPESWGHWAGRQALGVLPTAGLVAGSVLGAPEGGVGAIPAGAAGYTAGKYLENAGRKYLMGDELKKDPGGPLGELVGTAGEGLDQATQGAMIGKAMSPVADAISKRLKGTGIEAAKVHLRPTAATRAALGEEGLDAAAEESLRAGAIQPFSKAKTTAANLDNLADELGAVKGDIIDNSTAKIDPTQVADTARKKIVEPLLANSETEGTGAAMSKKVDAFVRKYAPEVEQGGEINPEMSVGQLDAVKQAAQAKNNYMATSPQAVARQQAGKQWAGVVKDAVEQAEPNVIPANRSLHNIYNAQAMAGRTSNLANNGGGLMGHMTDVGVGVNAARDAAEGRILGPTLAVARAISKGRVSSTVASGAYGAGTALEQAGAKAVNPVANAISSRLGYSSPRENQPQSTPKDSASIRQTLIDQQTSPAAQQALKESQE